MTEKIEITNTSAVRHLTIPVPEGGGVAVIRGRNGAGKSTALLAVESLYDKTARKAIEPSYGEEHGTVEGLGVTVRFGRSSVAKGQLVVQSLEGKVDPSLLVDPGIKDPDAADAKRLATLIRLANIKIPVEKWAELCGMDLDVESLVDPDDPVTSADKIRRALHALALSREQEVASKKSKLEVLKKSIEGVDLSSAPDASTAMTSVAEAAVAFADAKSRRKSMLQAQAVAAEAQARFDEIQVPDIGELQTRINQLQAEVSARHEELKRAEEAHAEAIRVHHEAKRDMDEALRLQEQRSSLHPLIAAGNTGPIPTEEEIEALNQAHQEAVRAVSLQEQYQKARETAAVVSQLESDAKAMASEAKIYRELAHSTDKVLEQAVASAGDELTVVDGKLCVHTDEGIEPFAKLSNGERWSLALRLVARRLPAKSIVVVRQEAFESQDPEHRAMIKKWAEELDLFIVTGESTSGDLRVELL